MSSPLPPQPGETDEQRKARLDAAYRKQAEVDAERRAEEAARGRVEMPPTRVAIEMPPPPKRGPDREQKMTPLRRAAGGAAKVRKGMMTSEGVITNAMNKVRGK